MSSRPDRFAGHARLVVLALCATVAASRLPSLSAPVSPDEGGFLTVGAQWGPGPSLYGHYWVDRPPLLIAVFALADALGGAVSLRVIGVLAVVTAVAAAAVVGWLGSGRRTAGTVGAALAATAFLGTPLFGTRIVDGELLASPLVLAGLAALLASSGRPRAPAAGLRVVAGALGAAAFLVKQSMLDVFVVAAVLVVDDVRRRGVRSAGVLLLAVVAGALGTTVAVVAAAQSRGTTGSGLWGAVVTFRFAADSLLGFSAPRLSGLVRPVVLSGAIAVAGVAAGACLAGRNESCAPRLPWRTAALVLCAWELVAVLAGASYWSHYLVGLVPGLVLLVAVACRTPGRVARGILAATLGYVALAATVSWSEHASEPSAPGADQRAATYVRDHARPGDTVVVAFGHADIVHDSGLGSPYAYLWALPAFVRDPRLLRLDRLLVSRSAPGGSLPVATWRSGGDPGSCWSTSSTATTRSPSGRPPGP